MKRVLAALLLLAAAGCAAAPRAVVLTAPQTPTPEPTPTPAPSAAATAVPTRAPTVPPPAAVPADELAPPLLRVLLVRSGSPVELPEPGRAWRVSAGGRALWMWGPLSLELAAAAARSWQVGAWAEPAAAEAAAATLGRALGAAARIEREVTAAGLTRVRVQWPAGEPADPGRRLAELGFPGAFATAAPGELRISSPYGAFAPGTAEALLEPAGSWPLAVGGRSYRGRLRARAVGAEVLLINELNLESYLEGVVPVEMGPAQFPELEALKAQAVAARTYAVAHLGDHADEGWDLCATPACQAYGGAGAEHPLSSRAVRETAGLIATSAGAPIDAMYSSTCGGHTEDAALLFPERAQPYLRGVPCAWERPLRLVGTTAEGPWISATAGAAAVAAELLGVAPDAAPAAVLAALAERQGAAAGRRVAPPDLDAFAAALLETAGVELPPGIVPPGPGLERLLFAADLFGVPLDPPHAGTAGLWPAAAALAVLELGGELRRDEGEAVPRPRGAGIFPRRAEHGEDLPTPLPLWERWTGGYRRLAAATVLPGTPLERLRVGERVVALTVRRSGGAGEADRRSAWREWVRERSWDELAAALDLPGLESLAVTRRSPSGRVVGLQARAAGGAVRNWSGFEVRQALSLPETLFAMQPREGPDGRKVMRFVGRGWGHGVGLCQHGSFGLARSGMGFRQILEHYYTGIRVEAWQPPRGGRPVE